MSFDWDLLKEKSEWEKQRGERKGYRVGNGWEWRGGKKAKKFLEKGEFMAEKS